jgi:hypothetical protein
VAELVYVLCALTSFASMYLLLRSYRRNRMPLLFWSSLCFVGLAFNNLLLLFDLVIEPEIDFSIARNLSGVIGVSLLLYGVLWTRSTAAEAR